MIGGIVVCKIIPNPNAKSVLESTTINLDMDKRTSTPGVRFITENGKGSGAIGKFEIADRTLGIITATNSGGYCKCPVQSL